MKICPKCNKEHSLSGVFCSRSCANSRRHSEETKKKISKSLISGGKRFQPPPNKRKEKPPKLKKKVGGYREGSGRGKSGYYKGIFCNSTYELVFVICCIDHDIEFKRFDKLLSNGELNYYPDFIVDNKIIEIKGYDYDNKVEAKSNLAKSLGYEIEVLYKKDLKYCFDWVKSNYKYSLLTELYDEFKPKFTYKCCTCSKEFYRDKKVKTDMTFCSRRCSGLHRKSKRKKESIICTIVI